MNIDAIKESLKARIDILRLYVLIIVGLIVGLSGIYLQKDISNRDEVLLIIGFIFFIFILFLSIKSYIKIITLIKKLENDNL